MVVGAQNGNSARLRARADHDDRHGLQLAIPLSAQTPHPPRHAGQQGGKPHGDTYVVCLACGKQFSYDLKEMRIDKPLPSSAEFGVLPSGMQSPRKSKIKLALGIGVPLGIVIGSVLSSRRKRTGKRRDAEGNKPARPRSDQPG